ncbi:hypothetical protein UFOVP20_25 [uncultured Caudovirales phage]|uniref:Uncharacterized protein n=1 Tax=uncultured Caudovirales phage TaxID=2100421 RepID=A0A6J5KL84_9CAUD|nr:hypothetical protein UFOVP20_25 [uncultured Caudovirales phage]
MSFDPHKSIQFIWDNAPEYAKAKGQLAELEVYKSSLKSIQMKKHPELSVTGQEREAYASEEYQTLCKAIGQATERVELLKWQLEAAKMRFEAYRTESSNNRQLDRMTK